MSIRESSDRQVARSILVRVVLVALEHQIDLDTEDWRCSLIDVDELDPG